jgi:hypothetical protein
VKDENGDLIGGSHNILNRWKNFSQLLNVHRISDVLLCFRQTLNMEAANSRNVCADPALLGVASRKIFILLDLLFQQR